MITNIFTRYVLSVRLLALVTTVGASWASTPHIAVAAQSTFLTAALPAGSSNIAAADPGLSEGLGRFLTSIAKERRLPADSGQDAQLYLWKGANYKSGRVSFWNSALQKSLTAGGYNVQDVDDQMIASNIYSTEYGLTIMDGAEDTRKFVKLESVDKLEYFVATHSQTGQIYIGVWIDQKEARQCLLAVAHVGTKAIKTAQALPAVAGANVLLVKDPHDVMKGSASPQNPAFAKVAVKPGYARGLVKTLSGKPIQGATITVKSSAIGGLRTNVSAKTNAQGMYEVVLPAGACQITGGDYSVNYNGRQQLLPLHAVDGQREIFNSKNGHVENFVLRTWGVANQAEVEKDPKYGGAYYGGSIRIQAFLDDIPEEALLQVTIKPQGPLLDGSQGRTLVCRLPLISGTYTGNDFFVNDIPIGRYSLKVEMLDEGDKLPLRIKKSYSSEKPVETMQVDFKPSSSYATFFNTSGIERFDVVVQP